MSIDWTKPIRTVNAHLPCRVMATDLEGDAPIALRVNQGGRETVAKVSLDGKVFAMPYVENIPEEEKFVWINVWEGPKGLEAGTCWGSKDMAIESDISSKLESVGRLKIKLERRFDE